MKREATGERARLERVTVLSKQKTPEVILREEFDRQTTAAMNTTIQQLVDGSVYWARRNHSASAPVPSTPSSEGRGKTFSTWPSHQKLAEFGEH